MATGKAALDNGPLLDLDTLIKRPFILIDDIKYDIRSPEELSVIEAHRFMRRGDKISELAKQDGEEVEEQLDALIEQSVRAIFIDLPDEMLAKLSGAKRWEIVDAFTALLLRRAARVAGAMHKAAGTNPLTGLTPDLESALMTSTGEPRSPGLSASMAEPRKSGWRKFLSFMFGIS